MKRMGLVALLGLTAAVALAPLVACDDDTTVNTAFKDAGASEGGDASEGGKIEAGAPDAEDAAVPDASDDGG